MAVELIFSAAAANSVLWPSALKGNQMVWEPSICALARAHIRACEFDLAEIG